MSRWNSNANESQIMINKLRSECGLVDVVHSFSPNLAQFPTYYSGSSRIDIVLVTPEVMTWIETVELFPSGDMIHSDHIGILIDFNSSLLFRGISKDITSTASRKLLLSYLTRVDKYIEKLKQLFTH